MEKIKMKFTLKNVYRALQESQNLWCLGNQESSDFSTKIKATQNTTKVYSELNILGSRRSSDIS